MIHKIIFSHMTNFCHTTTDIVKEIKFTKMATGGSDEIIQIKCFLCAEEKRTRDADHYCIECKNYYCSPCVGIHKKIPLMQGHKILDKGDFKSLGPDRSLPSYPTQRCDQHPLEVVSVYCQDHDDVACGLCVALSHRSCKHIIAIADDIDNLYPGTRLAKIKLKLGEMKKTMEEIKTTKEDKIRKLKEALNKEIESVKAFRQELQALLDDMEEATIRELRREFSRIEESLRGDVTDANSLTSSLNEAVSQLKNAEGNQAQEFVCCKSSQKLINKGEEIEKTLITATDEEIFFTADQNIKTFLQQTNALGKTTVQKYKNSLFTIKLQKQIDVKLKNDKRDCYIRMICVTEDGSVLLLDFENTRLKRMDLSTEQVKDYIDLQAGPYSVCTVNKNEAVVSLDNKSVQYVTLGDKMTVTRTLTMNHTCFGLAYINGKLFICDNNQTVYIYDMDGHEQRRITTDASGNNIFKTNWQLAVSSSADRVFVADRFNGVVVLDSQGNYLSTLSDNNVRSIIGVCTDGKNVFVSGYFSVNIVQFGHSYKILGEVGKVENSCYLCFDCQSRRLVVSHGMNNNKVTVLELE